MFYVVLLLIILNVFLFFRKIKTPYSPKIEWEIKVAHTTFNKETFQNTKSNDKNEFVQLYI